MAPPEGGGGKRPSLLGSVGEYSGFKRVCGGLLGVLQGVSRGWVSRGLLGGGSKLDHVFLHLFKCI